MPSTEHQPRTPSLSIHKASGQARVVIDGRTIYLGKHGTAQAEARYHRLIAEWLANNRKARGTEAAEVRLDRAEQAQRAAATELSQAAPLSVAELILRYVDYAKGYYVKHGRPTSSMENIRAAMRDLRQLYGFEPAAYFGPLKLRALQELWLDTRAQNPRRRSPQPLSRNTINRRVAEVKRLFRFGASLELVPATVYTALVTVPTLRKGRTRAREPEPVRAVPEHVVEAAADAAPPTVAAMIRLAALTGMRPGELVLMRPRDIDTTGRVWKYTPPTHKTEHHGRMREVWIGPRAQEILRPLLPHSVDAPIFSPKQAEAERAKAKRDARQTPLKPSDFRRAAASRRRKRSRRPPRGEAYSVKSFARAVRYACDRADALARAASAKAGERIADGVRLIPRFAPNQLRHSFATAARREFGIEVARVLLGHASAVTTEIYAERDGRVAASVAEKIG